MSNSGRDFYSHLVLSSTLSMQLLNENSGIFPPSAGTSSITGNSLHSLAVYVFSDNSVC